MSQKILSVFIDESGDFGPYKLHSPYYLIALILHNQSTDISESIHSFDSHLSNLGYTNHAIHTGPLIRRESIYSNDLIEERKVKPADYKLFQVADLICTLELLEEKAKNNTFSNSEMEFFDNTRAFKKNYLKHIKKKLL